MAISPDSPANLRGSLEAPDLGFELYSDASMAAARAFGIAFQLGDEEAASYAELGVDLEKTSGYSHHQLPVPSVFLVEAGGTIRWVYSNPDYKVRPENTALLAAVRELAAVDPDR